MKTATALFLGGILSLLGFKDAERLTEQETKNWLNSSLCENKIQMVGIRRVFIQYSSKKESNFF